VRLFAFFTAAVLATGALAGCSNGSSSPASTVSTVASGFSALSTSTVPSADSSTDAPIANIDHWHAAYGVYDCNRYLPPVDASDLPDPTGIHTHADGLIHIHPFVASAAGKNAVLGLFASQIGLSISKTELVSANTTPSITRKNGDKCPNGKPGVIRVIQFVGKNHTDIKEVSNPLRARLGKDQVIAFVFAPLDQLIGPPPSLSELDAPRDQAIKFEMTPERQKIAGKEPLFSRPPGEKPTKLVLEDLELGSGETVGNSSKVGIKFVLGTWDSKQSIDSNWVDAQDLLGLAMGRQQVVEGFEQGVIGMKVGGLRRIVIPPALGYGKTGIPPAIGPDETLVLYVRLVAVVAPRFSAPGSTVAS
jgi:peptidylprolyl isomerase